MQLQLGPLPSEGARAWTTNTLALLDALGGCTDLPFALPSEMLATYRSILGRMQAQAEGTNEFFWECDMPLEDLKPVVTYWVNIGNLSDAAVEALGGQWACPSGEAFHAELLECLLEQLETEAPAFGARLRATWQSPRTPESTSAS